jgi:regulator of protease activity HflC (stomatin/prohibitin superfamily)
MTKMQVFGRVILVVIVAALAFGGWSFASTLLSADDDLLVALGVALLGATAAGAAAGFVALVGHVRRGGLLCALLVATTVGCTRIDPGYEGIKVDMLGSSRGESYPIVTGRVWYNPYTYDIYQFPTFLQRVIWTAQEGEGDSENDESFTFRSKEGYAFNVDVGFGFRFKAGQTPAVFVKYRRQAQEITDGPFRDVVREAFVRVGSQMEGLSILGAGMTTLNTQVTELVREMMQEHVNVEYVNVVGKPRVDGRVDAAINAVIQATQQANEAQERVRMVEAEARQRVAQANGTAESMKIEAQAKADAIRIEAEALRQYGAQVIQMRAIEKWNGTMPMVTGDGALPFVQVPVGGRP